MNQKKQQKRRSVKLLDQYSIAPAVRTDMQVEGIDKPINPEIDRRLKAGGL